MTPRGAKVGTDTGAGSIQANASLNVEQLKALDPDVLVTLRIKQLKVRSATRDRLWSLIPRVSRHSLFPLPLIPHLLCPASAASACSGRSAQKLPPRFICTAQAILDSMGLPYADALEKKDLVAKIVKYR